MTKRIQAVLMLDASESIPKIENLTTLKRSRIFGLRKLYLAKGFKAIKGKPRKVRTLLTNNQLKKLRKTLKSKRPVDLGYEGERFWTTTILADYIERDYQVKYRSKTSYYLIFKRIKFTYHKPGRVYVKRNEKEVRKWKRATKPKIQKVWPEENTVILCADEMLLSTQTTIQRIWLPEGEYPEIEVANTRKNKSIYGFLNLKTGQEHAFVAEKQTMIETEKKLKEIRKIYPTQKLLLLWDNPGWHRGSRVIDFVKNDGKIKIISFPAYAPEENPQEHVWKTGRSKVTHNQFIPKLEETVKDFLAYLNQTKFPYSLLGFKSTGGM